MSLHQEFENAEGEEYQADLSALASPSSQNGPEVYILPLTEVSLPVSKQPGRSSKEAHKTDAASLTHTCFELQRAVFCFLFFFYHRFFLFPPSALLACWSHAHYMMRLNSIFLSTDTHAVISHHVSTIRDRRLCNVCV